MFHRHAFHRVVFAVPILVAGLSVAAFAQSPNTSSIAVVVFDQQDKTIAGAAVSVVDIGLAPGRARHGGTRKGPEPRLTARLAPAC